jgi:hypothetical protein
VKKAAWFESNSPAPLLAHLKAKATDRKLLLFAAACCRQAWHFVSDARLPRLLATVEKAADKPLTPRARSSAQERCFTVADSDLDDMQQCLGYELWHALKQPDERGVSSIGEWAAAAYGYDARGPESSSAAVRRGTDRKFQRGKAAERARQVPLVHELFGDPFSRAKLDPAWRTDTAVSIARTAYEKREFGALPILADALQDAGCNHDCLLTHLRDTVAPHYRGCWALDWVLGKE